jgi:hypothetical protein
MVSILKEKVVKSAQTIASGTILLHLNFFMILNAIGGDSYSFSAIQNGDLSGN